MEYFWSCILHQLQISGATSLEYIVRSFKELPEYSLLFAANKRDHHWYFVCNWWAYHQWSIVNAHFLWFMNLMLWLSIFSEGKIFFLLKKLNSLSKIMRWYFKNLTLFKISILVPLLILLPNNATKEITISSLELQAIVLFMVVEEKKAKSSLFINHRFNISFTRPQQQQQNP